MKRLTISSEALRSTHNAAPQRRRGSRESRVPEIIDVSINVLVAEGYAGYTINRVAKDAGIRLSTLQHYFCTREILLRATLEEIAKRYHERYRRYIEDKRNSPLARLEAIVDDVFTEFVKPGLPMSIMESWGLALHEPFARDLVVQIQKQYNAMFASLIGEISPDLAMEECELRGKLLLSSFEGLIVFLRWSDDSVAQRAAFRKLVKIAWSGISEAAE